jgi:MYXO-CTERM domain-containing protein
MVLTAPAQAAVVARPDLNSVLMMSQDATAGQPPAVVPEPAAALLGALGMLALLRRRRVG